MLLSCLRGPLPGLLAPLLSQLVAARDAVINPVTATHRARPTASGRRSAYHPSSATAPAARASQSEGGMRGSKLMEPMG